MRYIVGLLALLVLLTGPVSPVRARIYIDISSPAIRKLPVTINYSGPASERDIEKIIKNDLESTGLFVFVDPGIPGAELIADLTVSASSGLKVSLSVKDLVVNEEVLRKGLDTSHSMLRRLAHSISNDVYRVATGKDGIFLTKITYLVYTSRENKDLRIMDWDGRDAKKIVSRGFTSSHSWSQSGRYLFHSSERNRKWNIYLIDLDRAQESILFTSSGLNMVGGASKDDLLAFSSSKDGSSEIYTINIYGQQLKKLTRSLGIDVSPVFSPDGREIAFVSDRGGTPQIYIMRTDGSGVRRITFEGNYNQSPSWSADGGRIAYVSQTNGKNQIFVVESDGTGVVQLTSRGNNEGPSFSPDGMFLTFESDRDGTRGIYIMRANGEGQNRISPLHIKAGAPKWSPYLNK